MELDIRLCSKLSVYGTINAGCLCFTAEMGLWPVGNIIEFLPYFFNGLPFSLPRYTGHKWNNCDKVAKYYQVQVYNSSHVKVVLKLIFLYWVLRDK